MNHIDLLKQAIQITWRYRSLWIFGFFLALCGGGGGGGGGNINFPSGGGNFDDFGDLPDISGLSLAMIITLVVGLIFFFILLAILSVGVQVVTRTALIGMVRQIKETKAVTVIDGWHLGWSIGAWRLFLLGLVIGIPFAVVAIILILLALSPLLLLIAENTALTVVGIILTIFAFLFVLLILIIATVLVTLFQELAWRRLVLDGSGVIASLGETFAFIRQHLKDVAIVWVLLLGAGFAWIIVSLIVLLPISLIAAALVGGIPALAVYLISSSGIGAAIAGVPLALLAFILVISFGTAFYLIFRSTVWTLAYLELQGLEQSGAQVAAEPDLGDPNLALDPQPET